MLKTMCHEQPSFCKIRPYLLSQNSTTMKPSQEKDKALDLQREPNNYF
jgi:hypothetical protein